MLRSPSLGIQPRLPVWIRWVNGEPKILAGGVPVIPFNTAFRYHAAWTLGRWVAAGALEQGDVEDELYDAAEHNSLVGEDGERQTWATIRSGLGAGLQPLEVQASWP